MNEAYINQLVREWDEVYKKGQLSLWVLLAVASGSKQVGTLHDYMRAATDSAFDVKEQSLYRALRRFEDMKLLTSKKVESKNGGPQLKEFELTEGGREVLRRFLRLHVRPLYGPKLQALINKLMEERTNEK